jgi:hypothetical protein
MSKLFSNIKGKILKKIEKKKKKYQERNFTSIKKIFASNLEFFKSNAVGTNGILLVQLVKDYEYMLKLAVSSKVIADENNLKVNLYDVSWASNIGWGRNRKYLKAAKKQAVLEKIGNSFGNEVIFYCEDKFQNQDFIKQELNNIVVALKHPNDILNIHFGTILVGDLIYDTYLRYFHKTDITEINDEVKKIIEIALNIHFNFSELIKNKSIKGLVNSYTTYLEHGIPARICLENNIKVYTVGSYSYRLQEATLEFPYHQINHTLFDPNKNLGAEKMKIAEAIFTSRFSGVIDDATSYMRQSAFQKNKMDSQFKATFSSKKRNIVIYPHDYYDSQHINRALLFPNLYQYLKEVLENLKDLEDTNVFIKPHPNGIDGTKEMTIAMIDSFDKSHFHILGDNVSNNNIIELRPDLICTYRGTVGLEMAYFQIPTVAMYDNMYTNFNFVHTCYNKETYFEICKGIKKPEVNFDKNQIYSFYYQAFLEKIEFEDKEVIQLLQSFKDDTFNDDYLKFIIKNNFSKETLLESFTFAYNTL